MEHSRQSLGATAPSVSLWWPGPVRPAGHCVGFDTLVRQPEQSPAASGHVRQSAWAALPMSGLYDPAADAMGQVEAIGQCLATGQVMLWLLAYAPTLGM